MIDSLNLAPIVNNFYRDILEDETRSDWEAYILLVLPGLLSMVSLFRPIDEQFVSTMSTALAVLFGFTFTSLMSTARYSAKDDPVEERVVKETRLTTAYAVLVNLIALIVIVGVTVAVVDYTRLNSIYATALSAGVYFVLFHYLLVMLHLMKYLYLLTIGGAFEEGRSERNQRGGKESSNSRSNQIKNR